MLDAVVGEISVVGGLGKQTRFSDNEKGSSDYCASTSTK